MYITDNNQYKIQVLMKRLADISEFVDKIADANPEYDEVFNQVLLYLQSEEMAKNTFRRR